MVGVQSIKPRPLIPYYISDPVPVYIGIPLLISPPGRGKSLIKKGLKKIRLSKSASVKDLYFRILYPIFLRIFCYIYQGERDTRGRALRAQRVKG
jgi:hypothetical protein